MPGLGEGLVVVVPVRNRHLPQCINVRQGPSHHGPGPVIRAEIDYLNSALSALHLRTSDPAHKDAKHGHHKQEQDYHKDIYRHVHRLPLPLPGRT
jgi:hypothetical protein